MKQNKNKSFFPLILTIIIIAVLAVCVLCFAANQHFQKMDTKFCELESLIELSDQNVTQQSNDSYSKLKLISNYEPFASKFIKSLSQIKIDSSSVELKEITPEVFNLKLFVKISWNDNFNDQQSRSYKHFVLSISHVIEDAFDKQFYSEEKSISVVVDSIEKSSSSRSGMFVKMKISVIEGKVEISEVQKVVDTETKIAKLAVDIERKFMKIDDYEEEEIY